METNKGYRQHQSGQRIRYQVHFLSELTQLVVFCRLSSPLLLGQPENQTATWLSLQDFRHLGKDHVLAIEMQIGAEANDFICASLFCDFAAPCLPGHKAQGTLGTLHANSRYALGAKLVRLNVPISPARCCKRNAAAEGHSPGLSIHRHQFLLHTEHNCGRGPSEVPPPHNTNALLVMQGRLFEHHAFQRHLLQYHLLRQLSSNLLTLCLHH